MNLLNSNMAATHGCHAIVLGSHSRRFTRLENIEECNSVYQGLMIFHLIFIIPCLEFRPAASILAPPQTRCVGTPFPSIIRGLVYLVGRCHPLDFPRAGSSARYSHQASILISIFIFIMSGRCLSSKGRKKR